MAPSRLEVARIGRAHGLRGEVAVTFTSNRPERTAVGARLYAGERALVIVAARQHQGRWLVQFDDVRDRTQAEQLLGMVLTGDVLDDQGDEARDALWVHEMIGSAVVDRDGYALGTVTAVEANPAHDLLVLDDGTLIPVVFVTEHAAGRITVDVPDGLFEL
jgi:16S rRNA processing protein RimM